MTEMQDMCNSLIKECHNNISSQTSYLPRQNSIPNLLKKKIYIEQSRLGISPQEEQQNKKIINKLRKKYVKKVKEISIKKNNLGEDLLTFTPEEYAKLQLIDQYQEKGLKYHEHAEDYSYNDSEKTTAVERLKKLAKMDDLIEEVKCNLEWAETSDKENHKMLRTQSNKGLGFQKRAPLRFSSSNLLNWKAEDSSMGSKGTFKPARSLNKYYFTVLHKKTFGRKNFLFTKYDSSAKTQQELSLTEKIELIKEEASKTTDNICRKKSPFMTDLRKEAIYGCQVLRQAHKILKPRQLEHLHLSSTAVQRKSESDNDHDESRGQKQEQACQAEEILQKNYHRIKEERKRIIQRMIC